VTHSLTYKTLGPAEVDLYLCSNKNSIYWPNE